MNLIIRNVRIKLFLFFISFFIFLCQNDFEDYIKDFVESPKLIKNQLCSFNPISKVTFDNITCQCLDGFVKENNIRKINNFEVDCSYQLKSRLITFVLSLLAPIGLDYFYLEHIVIFVLIFIIVICRIVVNIILLNCVLKYDKLQSIGNVDKNFEKKYIKFKYVVIIIDFIFLLFYIINAILQGTGVIKDKNGFSTISDFYIE